MIAMDSIISMEDNPTFKTALGETVKLRSYL